MRRTTINPGRDRPREWFDDCQFSRVLESNQPRSGLVKVRSMGHSYLPALVTDRYGHSIAKRAVSRWQYARCSEIRRDGSRQRRPDQPRRGLDRCGRRDGHEIAVVASAMGSTTDELLDEITFETDEADRAQIVSMGERTSVPDAQRPHYRLGVSTRSSSSPVATSGRHHRRVRRGQRRETQRRGQELAEARRDGAGPHRFPRRRPTARSRRSAGAAATPRRSCWASTWTPTRSSSSRTSRAS